MRIFLLIGFTLLMISCKDETSPVTSGGKKVPEGKILTDPLWNQPSNPCDTIGGFHNHGVAYSLDMGITILAQRSIPSPRA